MHQEFSLFCELLNTRYQKRIIFLLLFFIPLFFIICLPQNPIPHRIHRPFYLCVWFEVGKLITTFSLLSARCLLRMFSEGTTLLLCIDPGCGSSCETVNRLHFARSIGKFDLLLLSDEVGNKNARIAKQKCIAGSRSINRPFNGKNVCDFSS